MAGDVTDICPFMNKPANQCELADDRSDEHSLWHINHMVELGFLEITGMDSDGEPIINKAYVKVSRLDLYDLASKVAHEQIDLVGIINRLDEWRNQDGT